MNLAFKSDNRLHKWQNKRKYVTAIKTILETFIFYSITVITALALQELSSLL
ncbi:hypothetical protein MHI18_15940 [Peribacillus sp. FSL H8-0477]|uniref:hypothetical protein n=1 Tax=Peribacillus sp. FSL H8-0477 TaxID=2921388 RepID=UPI0030FC2585